MNFFKLEAFKKKHNLPHNTMFTSCYDNHVVHRKYEQAEEYIDKNKSDEVKNRLRELGVY